MQFYILLTFIAHMQFYIVLTFIAQIICTILGIYNSNYSLLLIFIFPLFLGIYVWLEARKDLKKMLNEIREK